MAERWDVDGLIEKARSKEGVSELGPTSFREPLGALTQAYAAAPLNDLGAMILGGGLVHSLRMRLRVVEWVRRHPEIRDERIVAPIVVVGMMRSGTTLAQRLLSADPRMQCVHGWEALEVAPPLDRDPGSDAPDPRIERGLTREKQTAEHMPDLFAIHPMHACEAEEEIVFLADAFLSHIPESGAHVPAYSAWLDEQDFTDAYTHLELMLQVLQWQRRQRGEVSTTPLRWVLKTPAHLGYLDTLRARFPDLHLVHLHRDPRDTIASGASLNATLHRMHADEADVDPIRIGADWLERMGWTNDRALATRSSWEPDGPRVTDLGFSALLHDPLSQIARVYADLEIDLTEEAGRSMRQWLARRPRPTGRPDYTPATYGLRDEQIDERFTAYRDTFGGLYRSSGSDTRH